MIRVRMGVGVLALLAAACGGPSLAEPPATPAMPPPPPPIPAGALPAAPAGDVPENPAPPTAPPGAAATEPVPPSPPAAPPATAVPSAGPLPALPSQAPRYTAPEDAPPPAIEWTATYDTGRWVFADGYGWMWVPNEAWTTVVDGVPYVYLYTPSYRWTWYVSPWGHGAYHYGVWVRHPWRPVGWRGGWVASPHVVVRIGGGHHYGRGGYRGHRR